MNNVKIFKSRPVRTPERGTSESAGIDFFIPNDFETTTLRGGSSILIPSGIHVNIPKGYMLTAFNKSGIATKKNLIVGACVIDSDYQGEVHIHLFNIGFDPIELTPGMKIVQFILMPIELSNIEEKSSLKELYNSQSERGVGGFGSTGV